jgi:hypothetical protein
MKHPLVFLLTVTSGAAFAQPTGGVDPSLGPAESAVKEDVPPGGCLPIGLTASGEIVFPIQCKELIERQRGAVEQKPTGVEERPGMPAWANSDALVKSPRPQNNRMWRQWTANRQANRVKRFHYQSGLSTSCASAP